MWKQICLIAGFLLAGGLFSACQREQAVYVPEEYDAGTENDGDTDSKDSEESSQNGSTQESLVAVYVCGAVNAPGVYYLDRNAIKQEALDMAGGFADGAAAAYVNLAEPVDEGEKIYFPFEEELETSLVPMDQNQEEAEGKINLNTATMEELMTLPGIGESKALSILNYREEHGAFQNIEDIKNISGIKDGVYNKIRDYIVVN